MVKEISIKKAAIINATSKYFNILCGVGFSVILARLLTPDDFGVVAVTTVFTTFFSLLSDMGIGAGIIQNKTLEQDEINGIFSFIVISGGVIGFLFFLFSFLIVWIYNNSAYYGIGAVLSISLSVSVLNIVPNAIIMKNKMFETIARRNVLIPFIAGIFGIYLASIGFKYYSLVIQSFISALLWLIMNLYTVRKRFDLRFQFSKMRAGMKKIVHFSSYQFAFNIINYFSRNLDNILISKVIGVGALGQYDKAYKLTLYPVQNLTHVITPVLHPILSEHQNDKDYIFKKYMEIFKILSLVGVIITPICVFLAQDIILIMYGSQWKAAIPSFSFLSISLWAQLIMGSSGSIYQSINKTKTMFISGVITSIVTVTGIIYGIHMGNIATISLCISLSFNINFWITFYIMIKKAFKRQLRDIIYYLIPDLTMLLLISLLIYGLDKSFRYQNYFVDFLVKGGFALSFYVVLLFAFKQYKYFSFLYRPRALCDKV